MTIYAIMPERGFLRNNPNFHAFLHNIIHWKKLCEHLNLGVALVVREFHTNLRDRIGSTIFVRGVWVPFDNLTINRFFEIQDKEIEEYRVLYREPNYDLILKKLTDGQSI